MSTSPSDPGGEGPLDAILGDYFAGGGADPGALIAAHPEFADDLRAFFDEQDRLDAMAAPLRGVEAAVGAVDRGATRAFGRYEILGEIARGGMGVVYRARQARPSRVVALKLVRGHPDADEVRRFRNEAEVAAALDHPNIVPVYEVGEHDGRPFLAMRLIDGPSLADRLDAYSGRPREAAALTARVARAVGHAHRRGVLHRDLKPSNILIGPDGTPFVTDFGLAKRLGGADDGLTRTGAILGTPGYIAPEQAEGRRGAITTATDIHGLGAVLYALLTGRAPYRGETPLETIEHARRRPPEPPSATVDRDLRVICGKCLEKDPARRYSDADELADDLDRWLDGRPILARPSGVFERLRRWCRRNPAVAALAGVVLALVAAGLVGLATAYRRVAFERARAEEALVAERAQGAIAGRNFSRAVGAVQRLLLRLRDRTIPDAPGLRALRDEMDAEALAMLREFGASSADPGERSGLEIHAAHVHFLRGEWDEAEAALERAAAALDPVTRSGPGRPSSGPSSADLANGLGAARHIHGLFLAVLGRDEAAAVQFARADAVFRAARGHDPDDLNVLNHSAWFLAICPDRRFRDPDLAIELSRRAIALDPGFGGLGQWMNLGAALVAAGRWREAIDALEASMALRHGGDAFEWFFLAIAHAASGDREAARAWYDRAAGWMERKKPFDHELILFRREAAAALGLPEPADPWGPAPRTPPTAPAGPGPPSD